MSHVIDIINRASRCLFEVLEMEGYLCSVATGKAQLNDEDRLGGDDGVRGGVGRRSDDWICAALSCHHREQRHG